MAPRRGGSFPEGGLHPHCSRQLWDRSSVGHATPADVDFKAILASAGDKAKTVQALKDSFPHFRQAVLSLGDADLDKPLKMFGQQTTYRGAFILITGHTGEELGQSIAYARMNGIVPPRTEEQQQQQQKRPAANLQHYFHASC